MISPYKLSWQMVSDLSLSQKAYHEIKSGLFERYRSMVETERDFIIASGYAMHYLTNTEDRNEGIHVRRLREAFGADKTEWSDKLAASSSSQNLRRIKEVLMQKLSDANSEDAMKVLGKEIVSAIEYADDDKSQSAILRVFEIESSRLNLDSEHSM